MFGLSLPELVVIALIAVLVLGPERLPEVAKTLGRWFAKMRGAVNDANENIAKELQIEEIEKELSIAEEAMKEAHDVISGREIKKNLDKILNETSTENPKDHNPTKTRQEELNWLFSDENALRAVSLKMGSLQIEKTKLHLLQKPYPSRKHQSYALKAVHNSISPLFVRALTPARVLEANEIISVSLQEPNPINNE